MSQHKVSKTSPTMRFRDILLVAIMEELRMEDSHRLFGSSLFLVIQAIIARYDAGRIVVPNVDGRPLILRPHHE